MYNNKKVFVLGLARSGYAVCKLLNKKNCKVVVVEEGSSFNEDNITELKDLGIEVIISSNAEQFLDDSFDYIIKSPGIITEHPVCLKALKYEIPVINELEVAYHYLPKDVKIIGVTGSNGKTTTTTIIYEVLKAANLPVTLGGNIGFPMSSLIDTLKEKDILVLEISAQQLHDFSDFKFDISVLTNLVPVHIDFFKTYENYMKNKKKIFNHQTKKDISIINGNDEDCLNITKNIDTTKIYFSASKQCDLSIKNNKIYFKDEEIIKLDDIKIKGKHNYENVMCAIAIAKHFSVSNSVISNVLKEFSGVEHRLEFVKEIRGRKFYNDSKSTNIKSTQIALGAFDEPVILLLGGTDRNHSFDGLIPYKDKIKFVVCYGETKNRIRTFCEENKIECFLLDNLKESINLAYANSIDKDTILLSPACASWDQYKDFEHRGKEFKEVVNLLK